MKTSRHIQFSLICVGIAALASGAAFAKPAVVPPVKLHGRGTDILHLSLRTAMVNDGIEPDAAGSVELSQNEQGNANNQRLSVSVSGLETNNTYQLFAVLNDDTNLVLVSNFDTDENGDASLQFVNLASANANNHGNGNGNGHGNGHGAGHGNGHGRGHTLLSSVVNPVSDIRELAVFDSSTQEVLTADLTAPDSFQYLVKRDLGTNDIAASLRIKATQSQTQFRLNASGLNPGSDYFLVLNGAIMQTNSTDASGRLVINSLLTNPADILQVHTLALWDSASNSVVSTELP